MPTPEPGEVSISQLTRKDIIGEHDLLLITDENTNVSKTIKASEFKGEPGPAGPVGNISEDLDALRNQTIQKASEAAESASIATQEKNVATDMADAAIDAKNLAVSAKDTAVGKAGEAGVSAGNASVSEINANSSKLAAAVSEGNAKASENSAKLSADLVSIASGEYATIDAGMSATAISGFFKVRGSGDIAGSSYQKIDATTYVLQYQYPSSASVNGVKTKVAQITNISTAVYGKNPPVTDASASVNNLTIFSYIPVTETGYLSEFSAFILSKDTIATLNIVLLRFTSGTSYLTVRNIAVNVADIGLRVWTSADFGLVNVLAGDFIGYYTPTANVGRVAYNSAGGSSRSRTGSPGADGATAFSYGTGGNNNLQYGFKISTEKVVVKKADLDVAIQASVTKIDALNVPAIEAAESSIAKIQAPLYFNVRTPAAGNSTTLGYSFFQNIVTQAGILGSFQAYIQEKDATATIDMVIFERVGVTTQFKTIKKVTLNVLGLGLQTWTPADWGSVDITLQAGWFIGIDTPATNTAKVAYSGIAAAGFQRNGDAGAEGSTATYTATSTATFQYNWSVLNLDILVPDLNLSPSTQTKLLVFDSVLAKQKLHAALLLDYNFRVGTTGWALTSGWTQSAAGLLSPVGAADFTQTAKMSNVTFQVERRQTRVRFAIQTAGARFCIGFTGAGILGEASNSSIVQIDMAASPTPLLKIHTLGAQATENTVAASVALPALVIGRDYEFQYTRNQRENTASIKDMVSGIVVATISQGSNQVITYPTSGEQYGAPFLINRDGQTLFKSFRITGGVVDCEIMLIGNSRTDGQNIFLSERWCEKVYNDLGGRCVISALSGGRSTSIPHKLAYEIPNIKPKRIYMELGTNDQDSTLSTFQTNVNLLRDYCNTNKIPLGVEIIPPNNRAANLIQVNAWLLSLTDVRHIRNDLALSLNNDGVTQVAANYNSGDLLHENAVGNQLEYESFKRYWPEVFD